jgi:Zn-dependent protease with chaperone function
MGAEGEVGVDAVGLIAGGCLAVLGALVLFRAALVEVRSIERSEGPDQVHKLRVVRRRLARIALACGCVATGLCVGLARWSGIGPGAAAAIVVVGVACFVLPPVAARQPVISAYARLRGVPVRALHSRRRMAVRAILVIVGVAPIGVAVATGEGVAVQAVILVAGYLVIVPLLAGMLAPDVARILGPDPLPAEVQARLSELAAALGVEVHGRLAPARERKVANAWQMGWLPGRRYVLVTDYLLDELTPAEVGASLAHELGHARHHDLLIRQLLDSPVAVAFGLLLAGFARYASPHFLLLMSALVIVGIVVHGRLRGALAIRQELAADDLAVTAVGSEGLAAALTRLTELNAIKRDTSPSWDRRVGHPGMAMRIARLRREADQAPDVGAGPEK